MTHLLDAFLRGLAAVPERPAVWSRAGTLRYDELALRARRIAAAMPAGGPLGAVLGTPDAASYAAILGTLWSGRGYVPLDPRFPARRLARAIAGAGADVLVVAQGGRDRLTELLPLLDAPLSVILAAGAGADRPAAAGHAIVAADLARGPLAPARPAGGGDAIAYLLFTSGTTGEPKGVPVRHANVAPYLDAIARRCRFTSEDRMSQAFDLGFDLSVHDMFVCWGAGACLYPVPPNALAAPASFIREHRLTSWFCVPSLAARMERLGLLKEGCFPSLRHSLFCGEALPDAVARRWAAAAPASVIDNLYGPTEATIAITAHRFDPAAAPAPGGLVPIGTPLEGQRVAVVDAAGRPVPRGSAGELCLAGSQVTAGYWNRPDATAERHARLPGEGDTPWFRTGDFVRQDADGCLHFLGRQDEQVKIRGFRVELPEVDHALRRASGTSEAMALAWPSRAAAEAILAFVPRQCGVMPQEIVDSCRAMLPDFMVPRKVVFVDEMPRGANGKLDREQLGPIAEQAGIR